MDAILDEIEKNKKRLSFALRETQNILIDAFNNISKFKIMKRCEICDKETNNNFNVDFRIVGICESCANAIFIQQASWFAKEAWKNRKIQMHADFCTCDLGHDESYPNCGICGKQYKDYKPENWI